MTDTQEGSIYYVPLVDAGTDDAALANHRTPQAAPEGLSDPEDVRRADENEAVDYTLTGNTAPQDGEGKLIPERHRFNGDQSDLRMRFNEAIAGGPDINGDGGPIIHTEGHAADLEQAIECIAALRNPSAPSGELEGELENWADIRDDAEAIVACGERWRRVAALIGCRLRGFNDGRTASFTTPDGNVIEVGPEFRKTLTALKSSRSDGLRDLLREARGYVVDVVEAENNKFNRDFLARIDSALAEGEGL